jgi:hypothetical protein
LNAVASASRALVFLTVSWSGPERIARGAFLIAADRLTDEFPQLDIECFSLEEEAEWCQMWLTGLGVPPLGGGYPLGAGSLLWLESGRVVSHEIGGSQLSTAEIVTRTLQLWARPAEH